MSLLQNLAELTMGLFLHCLFLCWGFGDLITVLLITPSMLLLLFLLCLFHHLSSGRIMQSLWTGRGILTPQTFNKSAWLHCCSGQEALPWHGNWRENNQGTWRDWGRVTKAAPQCFNMNSHGSECSINYDRPEVPPALRPQCLWASWWLFWKAKHRGLWCSLRKVAHGRSRGDGKIHTDPMVMSPAWPLEWLTRKEATSVYKEREENMSQNVATAILQTCLRDILIEKAGTKTTEYNGKQLV